MTKLFDNNSTVLFPVGHGFCRSSEDAETFARSPNAKVRRKLFTDVTYWNTSANVGA